MLQLEHCFLGKCPDIDYIYYGDNLMTKVGKVGRLSWEKCSQLCRALPSCKYWTLIRSGVCHFMTSYSGRIRKAGYISGSYSCGNVTGNKYTIYFYCCFCTACCYSRIALHVLILHVQHILDLVLCSIYFSRDNLTSEMPLSPA